MYSIFYELDDLIERVIICNSLNMAREKQNMLIQKYFNSILKIEIYDECGNQVYI